ncbi:MAG TPA: tRNA preQ1(34) S-adenosylmethionine ribosyltransferase-isomerase QueA [Acidimicrobiia bacterium]|nr:tRNA preQ1(34) S-adenosylmethionine ribosyltransferase-isomerase QueA [Acidimicrobiia bacterium]
MGTPTSDFSYELPAAAIAQEPLEPRDASRLLDADDLSDHTFSDLPNLLSPGDVVVVNRTRVRNARLLGTKVVGGGRVEALLLRPISGDLWQAVVRPSRRLRPGSDLDFGAIKATITAISPQGTVEISLQAEGDLEEAIAATGTVPLPPYIREQPGDPERYQTIFARSVGSAAAPTAGLHFTPRLVEALRARSVDVVDIELKIGLDTFRPISAVHIEDHQIHSESLTIPTETADAINDRRGALVAVGTTVVRSLESRTESDGRVVPGSVDTRLYITPGYRFQVVDRLITNFHLPETSLIVLVAAFMGHRWRHAYETALGRGYRFASFGDAMIASRKDEAS